jgi:hypothetical protein
VSLRGDPVGRDGDWVCMSLMTWSGPAFVMF